MQPEVSLTMSMNGAQCPAFPPQRASKAEETQSQNTVGSAALKSSPSQWSWFNTSYVQKY
jgi:hypothetical protein